MIKSIIKLSINIVIALTVIAVVTIISMNDITNIFPHKNKELFSDGVYQECIISEPNEIIRVLIQDDLINLDIQKATFYNFNKKPHPANIYINPVDGVNFISDLNASETAYMSVDYVNHICEITIINDSLNTTYDKKGYYGIGDDINDIDDLFYKLSKNKHSTLH